MVAKKNKDKACLNCRAIYVGDKCPQCGSTHASETFKGRVHVFNNEKSEVAHNMKIYKDGEFTIKAK
jgi:RNA polymerase subunit RPABC4/transcription elongation factor Spt4